MSLDLMHERERPRHRADVPPDLCSLIVGTHPDGRQFGVAGQICWTCDGYVGRHRSAS